jgi:predicted nucleic acid-binding protein
MYLLDTNVLSELRRGKRADAKVATWSRAVHPTDLFLSIVTILEVERGILLVERRDKKQGAMLRAWLNERVMPQFDGRILAVDTAIAQKCAALQIPHPRPHLDALIAATAIVHQLKLATRNIRDFEDIGLEVVNPWA